MIKLVNDDLVHFSKCVEQLYQCQDIDAFPAHTMNIVKQLTPGLFVAYNEVNPIRNRATGLLDPPTIDLAKVGPILMRYHDQHPLIDYYHRTGDGRAAKISDFLSAAQWHRRDIYRELYRPMGVEDQMSITLPALSRLRWR